MTPINYDQLLDLFPPDSRSAVSKAAAHVGVDGMLVYGADEERRTVAAYGPACKHASLGLALAFHGRGAIAHYCRAVPEPATVEDMTKSKTMQALDLVLKDGLTAYAASKQVGISQSAISRALARREDKVICPCCLQVVREGFKVNKAVLKTPSKKTGVS